MEVHAANTVQDKLGKHEFRKMFINQMRNVYKLNWKHEQILISIRNLYKLHGKQVSHKSSSIP